MSTRYYDNPRDGSSTPDDFDIPSCTIEDIDRSVFNLFDNHLPFTYTHKKSTKKAPVIFASGERFAVLRRKEPLRDKSGALILPLISIMRTGVSQNPTMGAATNQSLPITIKRRLSKEDPVYQRLVNKKAIRNSDDLVSPASFDPDDPSKQKAAPGKNASKRDASKRSRRELLDPEVGKNLFEIFEIPPPKYITATYEITLWAQYTVQMNDMITALMSLYQSYSQRTFQLETEKGYWFVGYAGEDISPGSNFDDFTDSERIVRNSFTLTVPGYIVNPSFPGSRNSIKKYISAPEISFESVIVSGKPEIKTNQGPPSGDVSDYLLDDMRSIDEPLPGSGPTNLAGSDSRGIFKRRQGSKDESAPRGGSSIGGAMSDDNVTKIIKFDYDPFTGKQIEKKFHLKTRSNRKGESVLRESLD